MAVFSLLHLRNSMFQCCTVLIAELMHTQAKQEEDKLESTRLDMV